MTKKANPDYTDSAVSLTNSPELKDMLLERRQKVAELRTLEELLQQTHEWQAAREVGDALVDLDARIKETIDKLGGFQDIEEGLYALKQQRLTITYLPYLVRTLLPKFADALIEEVVNKTKMAGLLKGELVTQVQAETCAKKEETLAYIIKT